MAHNIFISTVSDAHNYYYYAWACWWMPMLGGCRKYNPVIRFEWIAIVIRQAERVVGGVSWELIGHKKYGYTAKDVNRRRLG